MKSKTGLFKCPNFVEKTHKVENLLMVHPQIGVMRAAFH